MTETRAEHPTDVCFGGLMVPTHPDVLTPRPWTLAQSEWAVSLLESCGPGPVLELFAGSGHIGAEVARVTGRRVVLLDASAAACRLALATVERNSLEAEVRNGSVSSSEVDRVAPALILADPPYVESERVAGFPLDPIEAIDGGPDGLASARIALRASCHAVRAGVPLILQLRGLQQVAAIDRWMRRRRLQIAVTETRCAGEDRAVALVRSL